MAKIPQSPEELENHLEEQLEFLALSAESFDRGFRGEAKRIAVAVRTLFHHTKSSKSLIRQLDLQDKRLFDSADAYLPINRVAHTGLLLMRIHTGGGSTFLPLLDDGEKQWQPIDDWWNKIVLALPGGPTFSRRDLILAVANKDGGAHVDPKLDEDYARISRQDIGFYETGGGFPDVPLEDPHLFSVRQIGHEVLRSFVDDYEPPSLSDEEKTKQENPSMSGRGLSIPVQMPPPPKGQQFPPGTRRRSQPKVGRNDPCPCGSGRKFKKCCRNR